MINLGKISKYGKEIILEQIKKMVGMVNKRYGKIVKLV